MKHNEAIASVFLAYIFAASSITRADVFTFGGLDDAMTLVRVGNQSVVENFGCSSLHEHGYGYQACSFDLIDPHFFNILGLLSHWSGQMPKNAALRVG